VHVGANAPCKVEAAWGMPSAAVGLEPTLEPSRGRLPQA
jgi:hypothetical protein